MNGLHAGEIAVQQRVGQSFPGGIKDVIPVVAATFAATREWSTIAGLGTDGHMWVTMLYGPPGFMRAAGEHDLQVRTRVRDTDPLHHLATQGGQVGMLIMDDHRRMRVNGSLEPNADGFTIHADQVFSNCGRYITNRQGTPIDQLPIEVTRRSQLTLGNIAAIRRADTFLIGTRHPQGAADASHRGGNPGFVQVDGHQELRWPDYDGNKMFMTLGNLTLDPRVGLMFVDWLDGTLLQVSGTATIDWSAEAAAELPGAQRVVRMRIDAVQQTTHAVPMTWTPGVLSRHNPPQSGESHLRKANRLPIMTQ